MSNTTNHRNEALTKLENLAVALADCGITAEVTANNSMVGLYAHFWNCKDGSTDRLEIWAEEDTDYAFESCTIPEEKIEKMFEEFCEKA